MIRLATAVRPFTGATAGSRIDEAAWAICSSEMLVLDAYGKCSCEMLRLSVPVKCLGEMSK